MNESFFILISILLGLIILTAFYVLPNNQIAKAQTQSDSNKSIWHMSQTRPNGEFGGNWSSLKGVLASPPAVGRNADDRLEVFAVGPNHILYHMSQTRANGGFSGNWQPIVGISVNGYPVVARNADDRLEVFAVSTDNHLYHTSPTSPITATPLQQQQLVTSNKSSTSTETPEQNPIPFLR